MKKLCIVLLIIILSLSLTTSLADSGWDYSYDSGSGWSSSSDWGSSSGSYSSSSSFGGSSGISMIPDSVGILIILLIIELIIFGNVDNTVRGVILTINIIICIIFGLKIYNNVALSDDISCFVVLLCFSIFAFTTFFPKKKSIKNNYIRPIDNFINTSKSRYIILPASDILIYNFSNGQAFDIYKQVQYAWSNFDYESLRKFTTDELFNTYKMQLEALDLKQQQNIMRDIKCIEIFPIDILKNEDVIAIKMVLLVNQKDYVVDKYTGKILRGNENQDNKVQYELTFVNKKEAVEVCPNCGAKIENESSQVCSYCGSTLVGATDKWVLAKKEIIRQ